MIKDVRIGDAGLDGFATRGTAPEKSPFFMLISL